MPPVNAPGLIEEVKDFLGPPGQFPGIVGSQGHLLGAQDLLQAPLHGRHVSALEVGILEGHPIHGLAEAPGGGQVQVVRGIVGLEHGRNGVEALHQQAHLVVDGEIEGPHQAVAAPLPQPAGPRRRTGPGLAPWGSWMASKKPQSRCPDRGAHHGAGCGRAEMRPPVRRPGRPRSTGPRRFQRRAPCAGQGNGAVRAIGEAPNKGHADKDARGTAENLPGRRRLSRRHHNLPVDVHQVTPSTSSVRQGFCYGYV